MTYSIDPLLQSFSLGNLNLKSRIAMSPMTRSQSPNGVPGQNVADYYRRRAEAGVGIIFTEGVGIDQPAAIGAGPGALGEENIPLMHGDAALAGWKQVVDAVHEAGGLIMPQLWHMGVMRLDGTGLFKAAKSLRPSGLWGPQGRAMLPPEYLEQQLVPTTAMTDADIADVIAAYARSAVAAKACGFDGVAIHGAHGYLMDTFFWAETNTRSDHWGGDLVARTRFGAAIIAAIRAAVGPEFPIVLRWSQWKQQDYDAQLATNPTELEQFLTPLVDAGVDLFDTSTRIYSQPAFAGSDMTLAGWTRKLSGKPSMAVGGIGLSKDLQSSFGGGTVAVNNLDQALALFDRGEFDLLAVGRSLLVDPQWLQKARNNEPFKAFGLEAYGTLS